MVNNTYPDEARIAFQNANCKGCRFADEKLVGTGEPCCTFAFTLDIQEGKCYTRRGKEEKA